MSDPEELYPPTQYGWGWILLALGIILLIVGTIWLVLWLTKARKENAAPVLPVPQAPEVLQALRTDYLQRIAQIETDYQRGQLDGRAANLELSRVVRAFVNEYSGLEAPVLSLEDLRAANAHPALIEALRRHYYPSVFRRGLPHDPAAGAEAARTVVTTWR